MKPAAKPLRLETPFLRVEVDPGRAGTVTGLFYKKAVRFPLISGRGAGVAASGALFTPRIEVAGVQLENWNVRVLNRAPGSAGLSALLAPGLTWMRKIRLRKGGSGLSLQDLFRNRTGTSMKVRIGMESRQESADWRLTDRSWIGDGTRCLGIATSSLPIPGQPPPPNRSKIEARSFFWRQIGQYGTGLLWRVRKAGSGTLSAEVLPGVGGEVQVKWRSAEISLPARSQVSLEAEVLVDEGGGAPDQNNAFAPVFVRSDFAAAGRRGEPLAGFVTVVSDRRRRVRISVAPVVPAGLNPESGLTAGNRLGRVLFDPRSSAEPFVGLREACSAILAPGKAVRVPVIFTPAAAGRWILRATVAERGKTIAAAESAALIDGNSRQAAWRAYLGRMPEEHYRGTWEEIGGQMARNRRRIGGPTSIEYTVGEIAAPDNDIPYYQKHLPFYAGMVAGMAKVAGTPPETVGLVKRGQRDKPVACMDVACYGPDGPINAFSKERDGPDFEGLGYVKVIPAQGHAFHTYMHHGVNSAGLSISGATLNEDEATAAAALRKVEAWKVAGRHTLPPAAATWMLLAMCRDVPEALALICNPAAPWESTGNLLLLDRLGRAARVESAGIDRQIFRHRARSRGFFVAGNYPHQRPDGRFGIGARWGQAANTMLRERFLRDLAGRRQGRLGFEEVVSLMQSHEAGGMCQHHHDNPGQLFTVCSSLALTRTSELWLSQGPPCRVGYVRYRLNS